jgi:hypothetical protein
LTIEDNKNVNQPKIKGNNIDQEKESPSQKRKIKMLENEIVKQNDNTSERSKMGFF